MINRFKLLIYLNYESSSVTWANGNALPNLVSKTNSSISHIAISREQIIDIINKFNPKKAHGPISLII